MSDYLERLVARNFDAPEAIHPQPVAPFESIWAEAAAPSEIDEQVPAGDGQARVAVPEAPRNPPAMESSPIGTGEAEPAAASSNRASVCSSPDVRQADTARERKEQAVPDPVTVIEPEPAGAPPQPHSGDPPTSKPPRGIKARTVPVPSAGRDIPRSAQHEILIKPVVKVEREPKRRSSEAPEQPAPAVTEPAQQPSPAALRPPPTVTAPERDIEPSGRLYPPRTERPRRRSEAASRPAEPPAVQVTIGRVEVRASAPPVAAARRRSPPAASMSLDDYLKQRAGGSRS